jgi:predicted MFS family arabinose efflux permease
LLSDHYSIDEAQLGYLIAVNTMTGLFISITAPGWIGRVDLRWAAGSALGVSALALLGLGYAGSVAWLFLVEAVLGGAGIVIASTALTVIARADNATRAWGIKITADVIFAGAFLLMVPTGTLGLSGFVALLAAGFVVALPLVLRLPRRAEIARDMHGSQTPLRAAPAAAWIAMLSMVVFYTGGIGIWSFLERLAIYTGLDQTAAGNLIALGLFVGIPGSLGAAYLAGRTARVWPQAVSGAAFVASVAWLILASEVWQFYGAVFLFNCAWNFFMPFVVGLVAQRDTTGRLASLVPGTVMLGGILGPPLAGMLIRTAGYPTMMAVMFVIAAVAVTGYVVVARSSAAALNLAEALSLAARRDRGT